MKKILPKASLVLLISALCIGFSFLIGAALYAHPNAEDFSLTTGPLHVGIFKSIRRILINYDGRYFTNLLHALNPLAFGWVGGYKLTTIFSLTFPIFCVTYFFTSLLPQFKKPKIILFSFLFMLVNYSLSASLPHLVYWMVSSFVYLYSWCFYLLWVATFMQFCRAKSSKSRFFHYTISSLFLIAAIGINEMFLGINLASLTGLFLFILFRKKDLLSTAIPFLLTGVISVLFFLSNPGIQVRFSSFSPDRQTVSLGDTIIKSTLEFLQEFGRVSSQGLLLVSFLIIASIAFHKELKLLTTKTDLRKVAGLSLAGLFVLYLSSYAFYLPMGFEDFLPVRIYTSINLGVVLILTLSLPPMLTYLFEKLKPEILQFLQFFFALSFIISIYFFNNNITSIHQDFNDRKIQSFSAVMESRYAVINEAKKDSSCWKIVTLPLITNPPNSIYSPPDIQPNKAAFYWNNAYEKYFQIDEVGLVGDTIFDNTYRIN